MKSQREPYSQYSEGESLINSIVGDGTRFKGHLELTGLLRIDGDFSGSIRTDGKVLIGKNGRADCTIYAETVVVGGAIRGNIYASERVIVLSSAVVIGAVHTPRLIAEEGVLLNGTFVIASDAAQSIPEPNSREAKQGVIVGSHAEAADAARSAATSDRYREGSRLLPMAGDSADAKPDLPRARGEENR